MWGKHDDLIVHEHEPFNAEPAPHALARAAVTGVGHFYVRNHGIVPESDPARWRLAVDGLVGRELRLSLAELREFDHHEVVASLQCAGNRRSSLSKLQDIPGHQWGPGATSAARWKGVRLADVLARAGVAATAAHVEFEAPDIAEEASPPQRFGGSIPLSKARSGEVLLAWEMNGAPLPPVHGAPVRVVVPGYIGARSVKWVDRITVRSRPSANFFQAVAYRLLPAEPVAGEDGIELGPIAVNSAILTPAAGETVPAGATAVSGYALAGDGRGVARVEVSVDGGSRWQRAELDEQPSPWTWRRWRAVVQLPPGEAEIVSRAWDTAAAVQPEREADLWNPKGYFNHAWYRTRVTCVDRA
ncbi:sulfite oxidase [Saccharopolyspora taberi]|uniref:Sulfite oxidase n=1 Tax=Saccharopolyspora taberi TaxID=60895 RepID=A0ABN3VGK0_9PSEU